MPSVTLRRDEIIREKNEKTVQLRLRVRRLMNMPPRLKPSIAPSSAAANMVLEEEPFVLRDKRTEVYAIDKVQKTRRMYITFTSLGADNNTPQE